MYGSRPRRRTLLTVALALLALGAVAAPSALAQSAGDEQYRDPLVTERDQRPAEPAPGGRPGDSEAPPASGPSGTVDAPPSSDAPATAPAPERVTPGDAFADDAATATLPRTGVDAWLLAALGVAALALGTVGLAVARDPRDARR